MQLLAASAFSVHETESGEITVSFPSDGQRVPVATLSTAQVAGAELRKWEASTDGSSVGLLLCRGDSYELWVAFREALPEAQVVEIGSKAAMCSMPGEASRFLVSTSKSDSFGSTSRTTFTVIEVVNGILDRTEVFTHDQKHVDGTWVQGSGESPWLTLGESYDSRWRSNVWLLHADTLEVRVVQLDDDSSTNAVASGDDLIVLTNRDAPWYRLAKASLNDPSEWQDFVPERVGQVLSDYALTEQRAILRYTERGFDRVLVVDRVDGTEVCGLDLPKFGACRLVGDLPGDHLLVSFSDPVTPPHFYDCDPMNGALSLLHRETTELRVEAHTLSLSSTSADGTLIPMTVVLPKSRSPLPAPTILEIYGGFGEQLSPVYSPEVATWISLGGAYAWGHLRGDSSLGEEWHRAGARGKRHHAVEDAIACAETLAADVCRGGGLGLIGFSNGALNVAQVISQRPDLFQGCALIDPLIDPLALGDTEASEEWKYELGDPAIEEERGWLKSMSPLENLRLDIDRPPTLIMAGNLDIEVLPKNHAMKYAEALADKPGQGQAWIVDLVLEDRGHRETTWNECVARLKFFASALELTQTKSP